MIEKKEAEVFEVLDLNNNLDELVKVIKEVTESVKRMVSDVAKQEEKGEQE